MILSILSKLVLDYNIFVSTFHSTKLALGTSYKMHTLDVFVASILQEKDNFSQMGLQNTSKVHSLASNEGKKGAINKNYLCDKHLKPTSTPLSLNFKQSHDYIILQMIHLIRNKLVLHAFSKRFKYPLNEQCKQLPNC